MTSLMCFSLFSFSTLAIAQTDDGGKKEETKKDKKEECKDGSCKKPEK